MQALIHGLNRHYYSIAINYRKTSLEENMLLNLQASTLALVYVGTLVAKDDVYLKGWQCALASEERLMYRSPVLQKHTWTKGLKLTDFDEHALKNGKLLTEAQDLTGAAGVGELSDIDSDTVLGLKFLMGSRQHFVLHPFLTRFYAPFMLDREVREAHRRGGGHFSGEAGGRQGWCVGDFMWVPKLSDYLCRFMLWRVWDGGPCHDCGWV